ncbi:MAG: hypothetical protein CME06_00070 [Gemmatimonadetes bacterium]|nr:hypothetical protein [Gemmatimonadota bacterium]
MRVAQEYLEFADICELSSLLGLSSAGEIEGLTLAEDIINSSGGVLYKGGSSFGVRQERKLRSLMEEYEQAYPVRIERNDALTGYVAELVQRDLAKVEEAVRGRKPFSESLEQIAPLGRLFEKHLKERPDLALGLFTAREREHEITGDPLPPLYHHTLFRSVMLVALMEFVQEHTGTDLDPEVDYHVALEGSFLLYSAAKDELKTILAPEKRRRGRTYKCAMAALGRVLHTMELDSQVEPVMEFVLAHYGGDHTVASLSSETAMRANFIIGVDEFAQMVSGHLEGNMPMREAFERILKLGIQHRLSSIVVEALARGFPQLASFDFYSELERILGDCESRSGHPHPIHSLFSATLVLCGARDSQCAHYSGSAGQPVYITQDVDSGLAAGTYGTCKLMTLQLTSLYDRYYTEIKEGVTVDRNAGLKTG